MIQTAGLISLALLLTMVGMRLASVKARQGLILAASYGLYASWGIDFLIVLMVSSLVNYICGEALRRKVTTWRLCIGVACNLLPLAFFKYLPALLVLEGVGSWEYDFAHQIIMPIGMSFWTFQGLSYLFDIYYEEELDPSLLEFCLYMAFWPTAVSGPVCRLPKMLPQFRQLSPFSWEDLSVGSLRVVQGGMMKFVLAHILESGWQSGEGVSAGFDHMTGGWGGIDVWLLGIGFGFLLFFDFAGYSHMVIGIARVCGIRLPENFDRPFLSTTPSIFWTRWHMSLSSWIRDYIFNPLAAAGRRYSWWPYMAFVISMALFGLWHGAKWTYVVYGVYHGVVLVLHRVGQQLKRRIPVRLPKSWGAFLSWGATFLLIAVGFIFFRANDLTQAWTMLRTVVTPAAYGHFAMPRSFYALIVISAVGYFAVIAGQSVLLAWRERYREAQGEQGAQTAATRLGLIDNCTVAVGLAYEFLAARLWWWFAPALSVLAAYVGLVVYTRESVIAITPFIYTLF
jgi:alginate O-acetyltransferase complex protein AlgI